MLISEIYRSAPKSYKKNLIILIIPLTIIASIEAIILLVFPRIINIITSKDNDVHLFNWINFGFDFSQKNKDIILIIIFITLITLSILGKIFNIALLTKSAQTIRELFSKSYLEHYANMEYREYSSESGAQIQKTLLNEIDQLVASIYLPFLMFFMYLTNFLVIFGYLLYFNVIGTLFVVAIFAITYLMILLTSQKYLRILSEQRFLKNEIRSTDLQFIVQARNELKLAQVLDDFIFRFYQATKDVSNYISNATMLGQIPKLVIDFLIFLVIGISALLHVHGYGANNNSIDYFSTYALAGYRLLPSLQGLYLVKSQLEFGRPIFNRLQKFLQKTPTNRSGKLGSSLTSNGLKTLSLNGSFDIATNIISFSNAAFHKGEFIGISGPSGSGKSTLMNIILGLGDENQKLKIKYYDNQNKEHPLMNFKPAYMSQSVNVMNRSVLENILIGRDFDEKKLRRSVYLSCLDDVFDNMASIETYLLGDNNTKLSGGQLQRICLARTLYDNPDLIVLDEFNSSLDDETSERILKRMKEDITSSIVIISSHNLNTYKLCDRIINV